MPHYIDSQGTRYWLPREPDPGGYRADLVLLPDYVEPSPPPEDPPPVVTPDTETGE
jgi:hypothetical protein